MGTDIARKIEDRVRPTTTADRGFPRAQSEPLAALVAVSLVCLVVSSYVVLMTDVVETMGTERSVGEPTADAVWQDVSDDGKRSQAGRATFDESGRERTLSVPDDAEGVTRTITVRIDAADKRPGQFTVEVWE